MLMKPNKPKSLYVQIKELKGILSAITSSRKIATKFGKEHKNVLAAIRKIEKSQPDFHQLNYKPSIYLNKQKKSQPEYLITFLIII